MSITLSHVGCYKNGTSYTVDKYPFGIFGNAANTTGTKFVQVIQLEVGEYPLSQFSVGIRADLYSDGLSETAVNSIITNTTAILVTNHADYHNSFGDAVTLPNNNYKIQCTVIGDDGTSHADRNICATFSDIVLNENSTYYIVFMPANSSIAGACSFLFDDAKSAGVFDVNYKLPFDLSYLYRYNWLQDAPYTETRLPNGQDNPRVLLGRSTIDSVRCNYSVVEKLVVPEGGLSKFRVRTSIDDFSGATFTTDKVQAFIVKDHERYAYKFGNEITALGLLSGEYEASTLQYTDCSSEKLWPQAYADMMLDIYFDNLALSAGETYYLLITPKDSDIDTCVYYMCHPEDPTDYSKYIYRQIVDEVWGYSSISGGDPGSSGTSVEVKYNAISYDLVGNPIDGYFDGDKNKHELVESRAEGTALKITDKVPDNDYRGENIGTFSANFDAMGGTVEIGSETIEFHSYEGQAFEYWYELNDITHYFTGSTYASYPYQSSNFNAYYEAVTKYDSIIAPTAVKPGYTLLGWAESREAAELAEQMAALGNSQNTLIKSGQTIELTETTTLYAAWLDDNLDTNEPVRAIMYIKTAYGWMPILPD